MKAFVSVGGLLFVYMLALPSFLFNGDGPYKDSKPKLIIEYDRTMDFLTKVALTAKPEEIHRTATELLQQKKRGEAILLLKRNFYTHLFIPSYFILSNLKVPVSFAFLLWHLSLLMVSCLCLRSLILLNKSISLLHIRQLTVLLSLGLVLSVLSQWFLKPKISSFKGMALKTTPSLTASVKSPVAPHSDLLVIEIKTIPYEKSISYRAKDQNGQTGWVRKQDFLRIF